MISVDLARRLRDAGLGWEPAEGDRFVIPDRNLDDEVFAISTMTVDVREAPAGQLIAFNGTVEWALDAIMQREVIWLPHESQLRSLLGSGFRSLARIPDGFQCEVERDGSVLAFEHPDAASCYGLALLDQLRARQVI